MKSKYTVDTVLIVARSCTTRAQFHSENYPFYAAAYRLHLLEEISAFLPPGINRQSPYTEAQLIESAQQFTSREEWRNAGDEERKLGLFSHYGTAIKRGRSFMRVCCEHMPLVPKVKGIVRKYSDDEIIASAKLYKHRGGWKKGSVALYQAARRHPEVFLKATAHMVPASNPYAGDYIVYAFEFTDNSAYVGLTFRAQKRYLEHMSRGRVFTHIKKCPTYLYKALEENIMTPEEVPAREAYWMRHYEQAGWHMLNSAKAGCLGTIQVTKWTKEAVLKQASLYSTKQEWIDNSQMSYRIAKKNGWFDEAVAHMPLHDARHLIGRTFSEETKAKMSLAKKGIPLSPEHRAKIKANATNQWTQPQ